MLETSLRREGQERVEEAVEEAEGRNRREREATEKRHKEETNVSGRERLM